MEHYLAYKIIKLSECSTVDWKRDSQRNHTIDIQQSDYREDNSRKTQLLEEAEQYEKAGFLTYKPYHGGNDIEYIKYSDTHKEAFYEIVGCIPKWQRVESYIAEIEERLERTTKVWIRSFYTDMLEKLRQGKIPGVLEKKPDDKNRKYPSEEEMQSAFRRSHEYDGIFTCLEALDELKVPMYKRIFSKKYFKDSKMFEKKLQSQIVCLVRTFGKTDEEIYVDDNMTEQEILPQILLEEYWATLNIKGSLRIILNEKEIDMEDFVYGCELNSDTLKYASISPRQEIRKIITVENKANFMSMPYEKGTLLIFSHGYPSPLERNFLSELYRILEGQQVKYYHTGDLDYGGVCIFRYIRTRIFPKLNPYQMDLKIYHQYCNDMGTPLGKDEKDTIRIQEKLKKIEEPLLQNLIDEMVLTGIGIEQESFLIK